MQSSDLVKRRNYHLDFIRVVAMLFVISIHLSWDFPVPLFIAAFFRTLFLTANGLFFLLSGYFALRFKEDVDNPAASYKKFYWKKFCSLVIPFIFYSLFNISCYYLGVNEFPNLKTMIMNVFWTIFPSSMNGHIWFLYYLIGYMMTAPFIAIMFDKLSDTGLKVFAFLAVGFEIISIIVFSYILRSDFPVYGWPFISWYLYFLGGYIINRLGIRKKKWMFIAIGIVCFLITVAITMLGIELNGLYDDSPLFLFACIGLYLLLESVPIVKPLQKMLTFLAEHSFAVYLIHITILTLVRRYVPVSNPWLWFACVLGIAAISVLIAYPCNRFMIRPLCKWLNKSSAKVRILFSSSLLIIILVVPVLIVIKDKLFQ
ncbi:MAG: acyltransferase [Saccharofermentans sp.]|nr:acyltransferase [Saccharofermentans sp.]